MTEFDLTKYDWQHQHRGLTERCHHLHYTRPNGVHAVMSQLIVAAPVRLQQSLTGYVCTAGLWTLPPDVISAPSLLVFKKLLQTHCLPSKCS